MSEVFETYKKCEIQTHNHMREFGATQLIDAGSTIAVGGNVFRNKCGWVAVATALEIYEEMQMLTPGYIRRSALDLYLQTKARSTTKYIDYVPEGQLAKHQNDCIADKDFGILATLTGAEICVWMPDIQRVEIYPPMVRHVIPRIILCKNINHYEMIAMMFATLVDGEVSYESFEIATQGKYRRYNMIPEVAATAKSIVALKGHHDPALLQKGSK